MIFLLGLRAAAGDWAHFYGASEPRDVARAKDGALLAAFAWGLQERQPGGEARSYAPGIGGLQAADFAQAFALESGDFAAVSRDGAIARKRRGAGAFEMMSFSYEEGGRQLLAGRGAAAGDVLILPFGGALSFFDYAAGRSAMTISQIGTRSLESREIERLAVRGDTLWADLGGEAWKRGFDWGAIAQDKRLADPSSWILEERGGIPFPAEEKPDYAAAGNFSLQRAKAVATASGEFAVAWGDDYNHFAVQRGGAWGGAYWANMSGYGDDQKNYFAKSLALLPGGEFAMGFWGAGVVFYDASAEKSGWIHSTISGDKCPSQFSDKISDGFTIVQGLAAAPGGAGYVFSYASESRYGLGYAGARGEGAVCAKSEDASSAVAFAVAAREGDGGSWEIYAAWRSSLEAAVGGVDFYKVANPRDFKPVLAKKWALPHGSPIDFAFDSKGVLWAVSQSRIFYLASGEGEWKEPSFARGFAGGAISALEADAQNGLWLATLGDGAYFLSQPSNSPDTLRAKPFKVKDGLLSNVVYDIAIDTVKGRVYFGNDLGLSVLRAPQVRNARDYMKDGAPKTVAYPNPFRPGLHGKVTIDNVSEKASVYIFDSSGKRVRLFRGAEVKGGAAAWDGRSESGRMAAPGLYHYIASDGKNTAKGKIIVER